MNRICCFILLMTAALAPLAAEISFSGLDVSGEETLLFQSEAHSPGRGAYRTLFIAGLRQKAMRQLTVYPEDAFYLSQSGQFQIFNRFGLFRTDGNLNNMAPVSHFPAFVGGRRIATGKIPPLAASPDGAYLVFQRAVSDTRGDLILYNTSTDQEVVIARALKLSYETPPILWAPDSRFFVYAVEGELYYYSLAQLEDDRVLSQEYRRIGTGGISSVYWNRSNELYYIEDTQIYQILSGEFFTRSLYSGMFRTGRIVGKLPYCFDPSFDRFWVSPAADKVMVSRGGRSIFLYPLENEDYRETGQIQSLPYLLLPRSTRVKEVLWSRTGVITLLTGSLALGEERNRIYRMTPAVDPAADEEAEEAVTLAAFKKTEDRGVRALALSPDETRVAVLNSEGVTLRRYGTWRNLSSYQHEEPLHVFWAGNSKLILAGKWVSESLDLQNGLRSILTLSQPERYGFTPTREKVQVKTRDYTFTYDQRARTWSSEEEFSIRDARVATDYFRVYTRPLAMGPYANQVMIRNVSGYGTEPLFGKEGGGYEAFPAADDPVSFEVFNHGSRLRRREVALVFNAVDAVEGLTEILNTLAEYQLKVTFFLNGEFLRRHPGAVKELAESGHEIGSLFHVHFDMADSRYQFDKDFIKRGLATNEDEYFTLTGKELALYWHAPYYYRSEEILDAAASMNYLYVGRDLDPLDWVGKDYRLINPDLYRPSLSLVETILREKKPGSIIPLRVGIPDGGREDYLFQDLDLLLNGLLKRGYTVVPISQLVNHAR